MTTNLACVEPTHTPSPHTPESQSRESQTPTPQPRASQTRMPTRTAPTRTAPTGTAPTQIAPTGTTTPGAGPARSESVALLRDVPLHGALSRVHAERLLGEDGLESALDERTWVELWPGVVVPAHRSEDPLTCAAAALLRSGRYSVLSGSTAAAMHGCTAAADPVIHVTVPYDRQARSSPGLVVHQSWIRECDVLELDGLRVHALDVAVTELLCTGPQRRALACLEQALDQLGAGRSEHFRALIAERIARRRDRRGTRRGSALLDLAWADPSDAPARQIGQQRPAA